jgi:hypothetical protein
MWPFSKLQKKDIPEPVAEPEPEKEAAPDCPYCGEMTTFFSDYAEYTGYHKKLDKILDMDPGRAVLARIETLLPSADAHDHKLLAAQISECFEAICEGKKPQAVLDIFEKICAEGKALAFAADHGGKYNLSRALGYALDNHPKIKNVADMKKAIALVGLDHPLVLWLKENDPVSLADFLDMAAEGIFDDWTGINGCDLPTILAKISERMS